MSISIVTGIEANGKLVAGNGWFEAVVSDRPFGFPGCGRRGAKGAPPASPEEVEARRRKNRERSMRRARANLRRKVKSLATQGEMYFLTVTYRENMRDYQRWLEDWEAFVERVRRRYPEFAYVCVAEKQGRGAWHGHTLVNLRLPHGEWEELWGKGFVWVERARDTRRAIRYVTKYLKKTWSEEFQASGKWRKRYLCSCGLGREIRYVYFRGTVLGMLAWLSEREGKKPVVEIDFTANEEGFRWLEGLLLKEREGPYGAEFTS